MFIAATLSLLFQSKIHDLIITYIVKFPVFLHRSDIFSEKIPASPGYFMSKRMVSADNLYLNNWE